MICRKLRQQILRKLRLFFRSHQDFGHTLCGGLEAAAYICILSFLEFAVWFLTQTNQSFWNGFLLAIPYNLLLVVPVFFLGKLGNRIYLTLISVILTVITSASLFLAVHFKSILDCDIFVIAKVSSPEEIREFSAMFFGWKEVMTGLLLTTAAGFWIWRIWHRCWGRINRFSAGLGILLLLPGAISALRYAVYFNEPYKVMEKTTWTSLLAGYFRFDEEYNVMKNMALSPDLPKGLRLLDRKAEDILGVVVIGESANRSHQGIYGYRRDTTPCLGRISKELFLFDNAVCTRPCTAQSLYGAMTQFRAFQPDLPPRCTLMDVLHLAGFRSIMFSDQFRWGIGDSQMTLLFGHAGKNCYIQEEKKNIYHDDELLVRVGDFKQFSGGTVVFLHLIGSHYDPARRYPETWGPFTGKKCGSLDGRWLDNTNEYDNSIAFTDSILAELIRRLKATGRPAFLLYFSDHGEVVIDAPGKPGRSIHSNDPDAFEIPFVLWLSDAYRQTFPQIASAAQSNLHKKFLADDIFWTVPPLLQITWPEYRNEYNLLSPAYQEPQSPSFQKNQTLKGEK